MWLFHKEILTKVSQTAVKEIFYILSNTVPFYLKQCKHNNTTNNWKKTGYVTLISLNAPMKLKVNKIDKSSGEVSVHLRSGKNIALFQMNVQHNLLFFWGLLMN